jgi:hypothetical protein
LGVSKPAIDEGDVATDEPVADTIRTYLRSDVVEPAFNPCEEKKQ